MVEQHQLTDAAKLRPHRPMLFQLYRKCTLDASREYLESRFDFNTNSKRPWTYQFEKSGTKKYKVEIEPEVQIDLAPYTISDWKWLEWLWDTQMHTDKLKADFCVAMGDCGTAFDIYTRILLHLPQDAVAARKHIIIYLVRCANTPENAQEVLALLQGYRAGLEESDADRIFLLPMLDAFMRVKSERKDEKAISHDIRQVVQNYFRDKASVIDLPHRHSAIDMVSCLMLEQGLTYLRLETTKKDGYHPDTMLYGYILRQPFFRHSTDEMSPLLPSCALWCRDKLAEEPVLQLKELSIPNEMHQRWWNNSRIFCTLWHLMLQETRAGCAPGWSIMSESALGISPTELLATLVWAVECESPTSVGETITKNFDAELEAFLKNEGYSWDQFISQFLAMNVSVADLINQEEKDFQAQIKDDLQNWLAQELSTDNIGSAMDVCPDSLLNGADLIGDMDMFGTWDDPIAQT